MDGMSEVVGRVLIQQPDRVAAAWRQLLRSVSLQAGAGTSLLDELVEPLVREIGHALLGAPGSPWTRTHALLRLSPTRGTRAVFEEFAALRQCLADAVEALGAGPEQRRIINGALDEALDATVAIDQQLRNPRAEGPRVPFGGVVVAIYEAPSACLQQRRQPSLH